MAAKLLHSLADENPDLQKQIGCMNGIFQLFDRQHILSGRHMRPKRLPPGIPLSRFALICCLFGTEISSILRTIVFDVLITLMHLVPMHISSEN